MFSCDAKSHFGSAFHPRELSVPHIIEENEVEWGEGPMQGAFCLSLSTNEGQMTSLALFPKSSACLYQQVSAFPGTKSSNSVLHWCCFQMLCKENSVQYKDTIWQPFITEIGKEQDVKFQTPGWISFCQFSTSFYSDKMNCFILFLPNSSFSSPDGSFVKIKGNNWCENALSSKDESSVIPASH